MNLKIHIDFLSELAFKGNESYTVCFILSIISNSTDFN